jgi:hypothetical protein
MLTDMFKEKLAEEKLLNYIKATLIISGLCFIANFFNRTKHFFISEAQGLSVDASKRDFCSMAINQMIHKKLSKKIIDDGLYDLVTEENYKNMLFDEEDKVSSVFNGEDICKVLVKTKDGLRSFDLFLEVGADSDFHYQIKKIHENELFEKESM